MNQTTSGPLCCYPCSDCWAITSNSASDDDKFPFVQYTPVQGDHKAQELGDVQMDKSYTFPQPRGEHHPTVTTTSDSSMHLVSAKPENVKTFFPNPQPLTLSEQTGTSQEVEATLQYSLYYDSQRKILAVYLQQAYNFSENFPKGKYTIVLYLHPSKEQVFETQLITSSLNPVFDKVFQFAYLLGEPHLRSQTLVFGVYRNNCCFSQRMVGVVPVQMGTVDLCGATVRRRILDEDRSIKRYKNPSVYDSDSDLSTCGCHNVINDITNKSANAKLVIASLIAILFIIAEVLGGYFAGSLAIMTDAAHMLSDLAGFLISLFAIWVGSRPPSKGMSFGWHRAEVVGAIISVLIVWVLTGVLFYEAILRVINPDLIQVKPDIMLITACVGVFVNVFMCAVLGHGHGHSHGGGGHGHSHGGHAHDKKKLVNDVEEGELDNSRLGRLKRRLRRKKKQETSENINVRAAFVHVIGDLIQSIGVVIAGYIIWFRPDWKIADPICTFLFCVLVLFSTINVLKDALRVLMEGTPKHVDYEDVKADLQEIPGVKHAHSLHIWSLTTTRTALAAHLAIEPESNTQDVLEKASKMLKEKHNIVHSTLQVEDYHNLMDDCGTCQETKKKSFCWPLC